MGNLLLYSPLEQNQRASVLDISLHFEDGAVAGHLFFDVRAASFRAQILNNERRSTFWHGVVVALLLNLNL